MKLAISNFSYTIPETDALEFARLPEVVRDDVRWFLTVMRYIGSADKKVEACKQVAKGAGKHFNSIYNVWKRFKKSGDWRDLIDRRRTPEFWVRDDSKRQPLPHDFITHWKLLVESNDRAAKPAHAKLIGDWRAWRAGDWSKKIPGYDSPPEPSDSGIPVGWTYSNLLNHMPTVIEIAAARKGLEAAKAFLPSLRTTRVGMYPFAEIQFDDMWHNFKVNTPGQRFSLRLLEFGSIDHFTTFIFAPGLKPRRENTETGKMEILNKRDFHLYLVNWLLDYGVHPDGTIWNIENGTASISKAFEEKLLMWFGGRLTIKRPGMSGRPVHPGAYAERAKGNFRVKALKEGMGNLIQNSLGHLPGQVGMNRDDVPAGLAGRDKENEMLLFLCAAVPELSNKLQLGFLDLPEAVFAVNEAYNQLNARTDHEIEGWEKAKLVINEFRFSRQADDWMPLEEALNKLPDHERHLLSISLQVDSTLKRRRNLSPMEVILGATTQKLIKPPHEAIPDLLGPEYGEIKEVQERGLIEYSRPDIGKVRFKASYQDAQGFVRRLNPGDQVLVHLNPWKTDFVYLSDVKTGRYLGRAARDRNITRADQDAIHRAHGEAERDFKDAIREVAARHGLKRIPGIKLNTQALRQAARPSQRESDLAAYQHEAPASLIETTEEVTSTASPSVSFDPRDLL